MNYFLKENLYCITFVTGPRHNYLGLSFSLEELCPDSKLRLEAKVIHADEPVALSEDAVKNMVLEGVERANLELRCNFKVSTIEYVVSDSGPELVYSELAYLILKRYKLCVGCYSGKS